MPKTLKNYRDLSKRTEYRRRMRQRNYDKGDFAPEEFKGRNAALTRRWTKKELELITTNKSSDRSLAEFLERSVRAIQIARSRYLNNQRYHNL